MELLTKERIQRIAGKDIFWQDAISLSAQPLLDKKIISKDYIDSVITVCQEKGPYMNIGPQIVLAHARPMPSTIQAAIALLQTEEEIPLIDSSHPARLWFFLATPDTTSHIAIMQQLAATLINSSKVQRLLSAKSIDDLANVFSDK
jgi:ascorbate PTS system EIIA or EIIAB component